MNIIHTIRLIQAVAQLLAAITQLATWCYHYVALLRWRRALLRHYHRRRRY